MSDLDIIHPTVPQNETTRIFADLLKKEGFNEITVSALAERRLPKNEYLAMMIWMALTEGKIIFADGDTIAISNMKEWVEVIKFLALHTEGQLNPDRSGSNVFNFFKVYAGIDFDKI